MEFINQQTIKDTISGKQLQSDSGLVFFPKILEIRIIGTLLYINIMDNKLFIFLLALIGIALLGLVAKFWNSRYYKKLDVDDSKLSWSIFITGQLLGFTMLFQSSMTNVIVLKTTIEDSSSNQVLELTEYFGLFLVIILCVYASLTAFSSILIKFVSNGKDGLFNAITENNIGPVLIAVVILFCASWICGSLLDDVFQELLPARGIPKWF